MHIHLNVYNASIHSIKCAVKRKMNKLKTFREIHKIEQKDLAKVLNTTQQQISLYETGKRELKESQIEKLCNHYKVGIEEILEVKKMRIEETMIEIGNYIKNADRKVTFTEILDKFTDNKYAKLKESDIELINLMLGEHNARYK